MARILIVEDEALIALSLAMTFRQRGHEVRTAGDGVEALEALTDFRPTVVVSDYAMPRLGGAELTRRMQARRRAAANRDDGHLIVLTAYDEDKLKADGAVYDRLLRKPIAEELVVDAAELLMHQPAALTA